MEKREEEYNEYFLSYGCKVIRVNKIKLSYVGE